MKKYQLFLWALLFVSLMGCSATEGVQPTQILTEQVEVQSTEAVGNPYPAIIQTEAASGGVPYPDANSAPPQSGNETGAVPYPANNEGNQGVDQATAQPTEVVNVALKATDPTSFQLASGGYQLVEFFAFWCPTCKSMAPILHRLENKYSQTVRFVFLDIDDPRTNEFKQKLGYQYQPHFFLLDGNGNILRQWVGYVAEEELESSLVALK